MKNYIITMPEHFGAQHGVLSFDHSFRPYNIYAPLAQGPLLFLTQKQAEYYANNIMKLTGYMATSISIGD